MVSARRFPDNFWISPTCVSAIEHQSARDDAGKEHCKIRTCVTPFSYKGRL